MYRSRIHKRKILLRFLGIVLTVRKLEVSVYIVYITEQFQNSFSWGGGGGVKSVSRGDFCPNYVQEFGLSTQALYAEY